MADNLSLTQKDLINRLRYNLPSGYTDELIKKPNFEFQTPSNSKHLRITVLPFDTESEAATGAFKTTRGLCVIDVFYPKDSGDAAQLVDVQEIRKIYENQSFGNTRCQQASIKTIG